MMIITRFAPSPTGNLHIGGARTALFNYLFAKANNGTFLLRIDDTDKERSDERYTEEIKSSLQWLGLFWDNIGCEVYQSTKFDRYLLIAEDLVKQGYAYRCYANEEESEYARSIEDILQRKRFLRQLPERELYTIRFKMIDNHIEISDTISGINKIDGCHLDDFIMIRQDKSPTYMLASVIDDYDMNVTHVIRGKEHLANTYRQLPLIHSLGYTAPIYSHIPLIHNEKGEKLSKRYGAAAVLDYKELGIMPEALANYLLRLGWGYQDVDIISIDDAKKIFSLSGLRASSAKTDMEKLYSLNSYYIKHLSHEIILDRAELKGIVRARASKCIENLCEKATSVKYIKDMCNQIFQDKVEYQDPLPELSNDEKLALNKFELNNIDFTSATTIKENINQFFLNIKSKKNIFMFLRISFTGIKISPGLFEVMHALGQEECNLRFGVIKEKLNKNNDIN